MSCRLCLQERPLCKSHVVSEFLFRPFYDKNHRYIEVTDVRKGRVRRGQSGYWDRLLCSDCETKINRFEKHSRRLFTDRLPLATLGRVRMREFPQLDYRLLKLFFLSVLWRASVTGLPVFKHVSLGPHEEKIRLMLSSEDAGSAEDYPTLFFILHFDGAHFRDLMPAPTYMRVQGRKCYRLVLTGFVVLIFVSKQSVPGAFPHVVWGPDRPVRGYDAEVGEFAFFRHVWDTAAQTTRDVQI